MPNYSLVVNSTYNPLSYAELLAPVQQQAEYQNKLETDYANLSAKAYQLKALANRAQDRESYETYMQWANELDTKAEQLSKYGLQGNDLGSYLGLYRQYNQNIAPIIEAQARRQQLIDNYIQNKANNSNLLVKNDARNLSLQDIMNGVTPEYYNGTLLTQQAAQAASVLANKISKETISKGPYGFIKFAQEYGVSPESVSAFVNNPNSSDAQPLLKAIYDNVMKSSGIDESWGDSYKEAQALTARGLYGAIGKDQVNYQQDWLLKQQMDQAFQEAQAEKADQRQRQMQREQQAFEMAKEAAKNGGSGYIPSSISSLSTKGSNPYEIKQVLDKILVKDKNGNHTRASLAYFGTKGKRNPLQIYEDYIKYAEKHGEIDTYTDANHVKNTMRLDYIGALNYVKKKYGVSKVLSKSDYDKLRSIGFNNGYNFHAFGNKYSHSYGYATAIGKSLLDALNRTAYNTAQWSINANPKYIQSKFERGLTKDKKFDVIDRKGNVIDDFEFDIKDDGSLKQQISDVRYSKQHPNKLIVTVKTSDGNKDLLVNPYDIDDQMGNLLKSVNDNMKRSEAEAKANGRAFGDYVAEGLYNLSKEQNQIKGEQSNSD